MGSFQWTSEFWLPQAELHDWNLHWTGRTHSRPELRRGRWTFNSVFSPSHPANRSLPDLNLLLWDRCLTSNSCHICTLVPVRVLLVIRGDEARLIDSIQLNAVPRPCTNGEVYASDVTTDWRSAWTWWMMGGACLVARMRQGWHVMYVRAAGAPIDLGVRSY
jgi:hypothetical protein